ncbi:MAG: hypothetical protein KKE62_01945 [Proteobacteria bacterium]|nr:hypothetical protein [Pseudomonadota bacterium]MBU1387099.1 hypothetical protein [Pseudomonadota bacterium]MBU1541584.1 hypothetical protein [Pseudomonadota bacterium]MBU2429530.1 hypothetical protein [Pseudomonadota bacterium]MBU2482541.1 hypothetical protein [Pseudomonadota bacterium]
MTALTKDRDTRRKDGKIGQGLIAASTKLYGGAMLCFNAAGYLVAGADTAGLIFAGICKAPQDNTSGDAGDLVAEFEKDGMHLMTLGTAITQANVGDQVYIEDDQTVDLAANVTNDIFCGVIAEFVTTTLAYVDITPAVKQTDVASHLSDATGAHAASAISIADGDGHTSVSTVEAALAELYTRVEALE